MFAKAIGVCAVAAFVGGAQGMKITVQSRAASDQVKSDKQSGIVEIAQRAASHSGLDKRIEPVSNERIQPVSNERTELVSGILAEMKKFLDLAATTKVADLKVGELRKKKRFRFLRWRLPESMKPNFDKVLGERESKTVKEAIGEFRSTDNQKNIEGALNRMDDKDLKRLHSVVARSANAVKTNVSVGFFNVIVAVFTIGIFTMAMTGGGASVAAGATAAGATIVIGVIIKLFAGLHTMFKVPEVCQKIKSKLLGDGSGESQKVAPDTEMLLSVLKTMEGKIDKLAGEFDKLAVPKTAITNVVRDSS